LQLQRAAGNRAVQGLLNPAQRKAVVGAEGGDLGPDLQGEINRAQGGGQSLDESVGSRIGGALGADLSGVRVHTDSQSDTLNRSLSAKAFTLGPDIFFSKGAYEPGTHSGKRLLAHELTHVVQQGGGKANKVQTKLAVGPANDKYDQEADEVASRVMRLPANRLPQKYASSTSPVSGNMGEPVVQRIVDDEIMKMQSIRGKFFSGRTGKVIDWLTRYNDHMHAGERPGKEQESLLMKAHKALLAMTRSREKKGTEQAASQNAVIAQTANSVARELQMLGEYREITGGKKLGSGQVNTVWKVLFGDGWEAVWKQDETELGESAGTAKTSGISETRSNMGSRNIAMYRLDQLLGTGVIPRTERAVWGEKAGTVMQMVKGKQLHTTIMGGDDGTRPVGQKSLDVDYANPALQRGLSNLQVLDAIAGQVDRHGGNIIVETDGGGNVTGIKGIDNDFAFGTNVQGDKSGAVSHERGMPKYVDLRTAQRMVKVTDDMVRQCLAGLLSPEEIEKTVQRFDYARAYCRTLLKYSGQGSLTGGRAVSQWDQASHDEQMQTAQASVKAAGDERFNFARGASGSYLWANSKTLQEAKGYSAKGDQSFKLIDLA